VATVAAAQAQWNDAVRGWEEVRRSWSALGRPYDQSQALIELGRALLRRGQDDRDAARRALLEAREIAEGLGASDVTVIDDLLRRGRLIAPPSRQARSDLSDRERGVAALVAQGRTNRQIGEMLFLSEKTVENHVGRMLAKLGLNSRAQLAAFATARGLNEEHPSSVT
jgi:DNA-binding CsgD family transcriptional regulator